MKFQSVIDSLLDEMNHHHGLAPVDTAQFWHDQDLAAKDPFGSDIPQVPMNLTSPECVFDELGIPEDYRKLLFPEFAQWRFDTFRQYNDKAESIVGRRLLPEIDPAKEDPTLFWPPIKQLHDIFEAKNEWEGGAGGSWWLKRSANGEAELSDLLDRVETRLENLSDFLFPENWEAQKQRMFAAGLHVPQYRSQRGPCTFACSIFGAENLLMLYYDNESLFRRFSDVIGRTIVARAEAIDDENDPEWTLSRPMGWAWADDNSCLFNPGIYEVFAMPIHRLVFGKFAPDKKRDSRYQHSDSAMGHILPLLAELDLTGTNFGPTLTVSEIRKYCPDAVIHGQLAPFTLSRSEHANIVAEFLRDFEQAKEKRGLLFTTSGSINNGSSLQSIRLVMAVIQHHGRYGGQAEPSPGNYPA